MATLPDVTQLPDDQIKFPVAMHRPTIVHHKKSSAGTILLVLIFALLLVLGGLITYGVQTGRITLPA